MSTTLMPTSLLRGLLALGARCHGRPAPARFARRRPAAAQMAFGFATGLEARPAARQARLPLGEQGAGHGTAHAPAGGIDIAGKHFEGGEFIPPGDMARATPAEKAEVESPGFTPARTARPLERGRAPRPVPRAPATRPQLPGPLPESQQPKAPATPADPLDTVVARHDAFARKARKFADEARQTHDGSDASRHRVQEAERRAQHAEGQAKLARQAVARQRGEASATPPAAPGSPATPSAPAEPTPRSTAPPASDRQVWDPLLGMWRFPKPASATPTPAREQAAVHRTERGMTPAERSALAAARRQARANYPAGAASPKRALTPAEFAERVHVAAARVGAEGRFGDNKVFIADAWKTAQSDPALRGMGLDEFKRRLQEANTARHLDLARADLVEAMDPQRVLESEAVDPFVGSSRHFIRLPQAQPAVTVTAPQGQLSPAAADAVRSRERELTSAAEARRRAGIATQEARVASRTPEPGLVAVPVLPPGAAARTHDYANPRRWRLGNPGLPGAGTVHAIGGGIEGRTNPIASYGDFDRLVRARHPSAVAVPDDRSGKPRQWVLPDGSVVATTLNRTSGQTALARSGWIAHARPARMGRRRSLAARPIVA